MPSPTKEEQRWRTALESGRFGVWDLTPTLEMVHYSPQWKLRLGFPQVHAADSTSFWRCRVHPDDLEPMLATLRSHLDGYTATYEMRFRLRSNGSGYRKVLSCGRVVDRDHRGDARRMIGTMIDLTERPATPLRDGLSWSSARSHSGLGMPFHEILGTAAGDRLLGRVDDLLELALRESSPG